MAIDQTTVVVVNQLYRERLGLLYERDYYLELYKRTIRYARVFDYSIGLGSAMSGGTGLGILADPKFAWICGIITTISILLSIAKGIWDWPGKTKFALDRIQFYDAAHSGYKSLTDDVNAAQQWNADFASRRNTLRQSSAPTTPDPYPQLSLKKKRSIQNAIKERVSYNTWWEWKP